MPPARIAAMSEERWQPFRGKRPQPTVPQPPDAVLFSITKDHVKWSCELRFQHIEYLPFELRILRNGDFFGSQRFAMKEQTERWANEQRQHIERGWAE